MPVIVDPDEPPAKCCKFCEESTHGVDGPASWPLTLDQDLIDTLKGSFPSWFQVSSSLVNCQQSENNRINHFKNCAASVSIRENCGNTCNTAISPASISPAFSIVSWASSSSATSSNKSCYSVTNSSSSLSSSSSPSSLSPLSCTATLLTAFSPSTSRTEEIITKASYNGLLDHISKSFIKQDIQDSVFLCDTFADMSKGDYRLCTNSSLLESDDGTNSDLYDQRQSPPKAIIDSSPLQSAMHKNKESLQVKLMVRRPHSQLVEQGIIPTLKTSPAIHEQCKQLERAKTGDLLKAKIQQRPNREELERRHILEEDECHIDPSLAEKQRMLKKARLADQLNSQIQHRPGPLELIKKNILHTEKPIEKIVKEGLVSFKATSEGLLTRPQHPNSYITFEDDSQSSESDTRNTPPRTRDEVLVSFGTGATGSNIVDHATNSAEFIGLAVTIPPSEGREIVSSPTLKLSKLQTSEASFCSNRVGTAYIPPPPPLPSSLGEVIHVKQETANLFEELCQSVAGPNASPGFPSVATSPLSLGSTTSTLSPLSSVTPPPHMPTPRPTILSPTVPLQVIISSQKTDAPGKDKNRKKSKIKPISKARTIKFHEYKGPPSAAQRINASEATAAEETSYQLMLEQQNCLLKFLEHLNKNQSIVPSPSCNSNASFTNSVSKTFATAIASSPSNTLISTINYGDSASCNSSQSSFSITSTPRPPPMPSPALSVVSSIAPSPAASYAESNYSVSDVSRLEKMKVSDLKLQLKRRNLPVSGPKPLLIERLKPYFLSDSMDCTQPDSNFSMLTSVAEEPANDNNRSSNSIFKTKPVSPRQSTSPESKVVELEKMDIAHQSSKPAVIQTLTSFHPQGQMATFITLSNEDLLREQQKKIYELQRQLQRSQEELLQIRQKQQTPNLSVKENRQLQKGSVAASITSTSTSFENKESIHHKINARPQQQVSRQQQPQSQQKLITTNASTMSQKMVVKQHLEAKIYKQKQAAAAAAAAVAAQSQLQALSYVPAQTQTQAQTRVLAPQKALPVTKCETEEKQILTNLQKNNLISKTIGSNSTSLNSRIPNNVGLVWNEGHQTIFLVGIPESVNSHANRTSSSSIGDNEILVNECHRTTSLPSIVFPISATATSVIEHVMEPKTILAQNKLNQVRQQQQQQPPQHQQQEKLVQIIPQLDIKPQNFLQPSVYEEATKQSQNCNPVVAVRIKEEVQSSANKRRNQMKSEKLTDVLDILIKQGELPHSVLDSSAPSLPGGNNALMTDVSGNIVFVQSTSTSTTVAATTTIAFQLTNTSTTSTSGPTPLSTTCLNLDHELGKNIEMSSPLQLSIDSEAAAKTLDVFLEQQHLKKAPAEPLKEAAHHRETEQNNHENASSSTPIEESVGSDNSKLNHFDEFELLELMSQQLEMDISVEENCHNFNHPTIKQPFLASQNYLATQINGNHRDMNPSLQPSINELIQQQFLSTSNNNIKNLSSGKNARETNSSMHKTDNNRNLCLIQNSYPALSDPNRRSSMSNRSFISPVKCKYNNTHTNDSDSANRFDRTNFADLRTSSSENNYSSTPMDVCDDFDNPLGSFSFSQLSPNSNINTPPHPFGNNSAGEENCGLAVSSLVHPYSESSTLHEQMTVCTDNSVISPSDGFIENGDSFSVSHLSPISQDTILDLFNIDDYKMSWGEGDFAV